MERKCRAIPIGINPINAANNNGAIGPSKKYNEDGRLALDEMQRNAMGQCALKINEDS